MTPVPGVRPLAVAAIPATSHSSNGAISSERRGAGLVDQPIAPIAPNKVQSFQRESYHKPNTNWIRGLVNQLFAGFDRRLAEESSACANVEASGPTAQPFLEAVCTSAKPYETFLVTLPLTEPTISEQDLLRGPTEKILQAVLNDTLTFIQEALSKQFPGFSMKGLMKITMDGSGFKVLLVVRISGVDPKLHSEMAQQTAEMLQEGLSLPAGLLATRTVVLRKLDLALSSAIPAPLTN